MSEVEIPEYPCVEFLAKNVMNLTYNDTGARVFIKGDEIRFYPISGYDDLTHIHQLRTEKGWPVIAVHNLDKLSRSKLQERAMIEREIGALAIPPELVAYKEEASGGQSKRASKRVRGASASA